MHNCLALASLRTENKKTQQELADLLHVSLSTYKLYEAGTIPMKIGEVNILSSYYDVSFDYILGLSRKKDRDHFRKSVDYRYLTYSIKYLRKRSHFTQETFARKFGISINSISKYENDGTSVTIAYLIEIAKLFRISSDYLSGKSFKKEIL